jgi:tetratricopeptide (TPR) repeat protein
MTINPPSRDTAIKFALENKWEEAYEENLKLLAENPQDIDSLNRIAYALIKLGNYKKAEEYYQQVVAQDKTNPIAIKNLKRLETISKSEFKKSDGAASMNITNMTDIFIEEAGKTKTVDLKNIADKKTLSLLEPGESVMLVVKRSKVFVQMGDKTFIGMLPDNIGMRMITFINGGNEYEAYIKGVEENAVSIFIKETKKATKFKNQPSFINIPFSSPFEEK